MNAKIREYITDNYPDSYLFDDLDEAIVGVATTGAVIYGFDEIIHILMERDGMNYEEAVEYLDYNIERTLPYMNEGIAPVIMKNIEI